MMIIYKAFNLIYLATMKMRFLLKKKMKEKNITQQVIVQKGSA